MSRFRGAIVLAVALGVAGGTIAAAVIATRRNAAEMDVQRPSAPRVVAAAAPRDAAVVVLAPPHDVLATPGDASSNAVAPRAPADGANPRPSAAETANRFNELGKQALRSRNYDDARAYFEKAYGAVAEPKYLFNLATANSTLGRFREALKLARRLLTISPSPELAEKTQKLIDKTRAEMKAQNISESD